MTGRLSLIAASEPKRLCWVLRAGERELLIGSGYYVLGRGFDADLGLDDESVSRRHAALRLEADGAPSVEDLGSRNGTFVNDQRIAGRVGLVMGDRIALGACRLDLLHSRLSDSLRPEPITQPLLRPIGDHEDGPLAALSPRERELFALLAHGLPQRDIAQRLSVSVKTIETHRTRIGHKLGLRTRADLIRYALEAGVLRKSGEYPCAD